MPPVAPTRYLTGHVGRLPKSPDVSAHRALTTHRRGSRGAAWQGRVVRGCAPYCAAVGRPAANGVQARPVSCSSIDATGERRGRRGVLSTAVLQGPIFASVKAVVDRGGAVQSPPDRHLTLLSLSRFHRSLALVLLVPESARRSRAAPEPALGPASVLTRTTPTARSAIVGSPKANLAPVCVANFRAILVPVLLGSGTTLVDDLSRPGLGASGARRAGHSRERRCRPHPIRRRPLGALVLDRGPPEERFVTGSSGFAGRGS
ncbi:hypothetical protein SAMN05446589_1423 [Streptomyces sp. OV198]|nr:hypothetical protein SAMN05446589_1423 [Streptomyces sp. OV198]